MGNWILVQTFVNDSELTLSNCSKKGTLEFNNNNTYTSNAFFSLDNEDECESVIERGDWLIDNEGKLIITKDTGEIEKYTFSFVGSTLITEFYVNSSSTHKSIWRRL